MYPPLIAPLTAVGQFVSLPFDIFRFSLKLSIDYLYGSLLIFTKEFVVVGLVALFAVIIVDLVGVQLSL